MKFQTRALHVGQEPDPGTRATVIPIHPSSTFTLEAPGVTKGYHYSRIGNPTRAALEEVLASLEGGGAALSFASGTAAMWAVVALLKPGERIVAGLDLYGGTHQLLTKVASHHGIATDIVDMRNPARLDAALTPATKLVWVETPGNPLLTIVDIAALAGIIAKRSPKPYFCVDNTFATPCFQNPLGLGADFVVHSTTKYIGGHSDVVGGAVVVKEKGASYDALKFHQSAVGAVPSPFDCWLQVRGLKTLAVRMREHEKNATAVAKFLEGHPAVEWVSYPGLPSHPQHDLAKRQMKGFSGMVTCSLKGGEEAAVKLVTRTRIFGCATSLGGVESLIAYVPVMTHFDMSEEERARQGITPGTVRMSVGIEDAGDLIADLEQALGA
jgi:cystathionine gamma-synthase/cystathionine gamma-lyase